MNVMATMRGGASHPRGEPGEGHDNGRVDEEIDDAVLRDTMLDAIDRGEFGVYYQPIVGFDPAEVVGFEALLRWVHPRYGVLAPARFLHLAEQNGLIVPIGAAVIAAACRQAARWAGESVHGRPLTVAVNLSARQLLEGDLVTTVRAALNESGLEPHLLLLEVNESALVEHMDVCVPVLRDLHDLGVGLCVDDFGAHHTSLRLLRDLRVTALKVDRSYVAGLGRDAEDAAVVEAVVAFAHALGITVTAQGIDEPRQLSEVRSLGCDRGQGRYFASPQPGEVVQALVHHSFRWAEHHTAA
jgi:EAL domain-containing protein (putative c-di-GMP-specific phosphodiesterase class I)